MKQTIFTLLLFCVIGLISCRKDKYEPDIKQYDQNQIQSYISAQGITGMVRDTVGGDTTGIYYKLMLHGSGAPLQYTDNISFVFTLRSFDGKYTNTDTIANHYDDYLGHVTTGGLPLGLQLALKNDLKYKGASMRLMIPSHLAYGVNGNGTGSSQNTNTRILGNQCLDYYVHVIGGAASDQLAYDDEVIQNYMKNNGLTGYNKTSSGLYYKILTPATGSDPITINSTINANYTAQLLNKTIIDSAYNGTQIAVDNIADFATQGVVEGLENYASIGTKISLIMPSALGYGKIAQTSVPANSCLRFTWVILSVTP
jgi:FKBP-type peptidyl-prolyl cis-trans isomerase FkpA